MNAPILVRCSPEIVEELEREPRRVVLIAIVKHDDESHDLIIKTPELADA